MFKYTLSGFSFGGYKPPLIFMKSVKPKFSEGEDNVC